MPDIKQAAAQAVLRKKQVTAEVLMKDFGFGAMARPGLAYEQVADFNLGFVTRHRSR